MGQTENRIKALRAAALAFTIKAASAQENAENHGRLKRHLAEASNKAHDTKQYAKMAGYSAAAQERAKREELALDRAAGAADVAQVLECMALELEGYAMPETPTAASIMEGYAQAVAQGVKP